MRGGKLFEFDGYQENLKLIRCGKDRSPKSVYDKGDGRHPKCIYSREESFPKGVKIDLINGVK